MRAAFDLHFHSCLSPCGDEAMTPATIAGMCKLAGLDVAALTDHNSCGNCAAFCEACEAYGLLGIPGMELSTAEEVHVVCLLPNLAAAEGFHREVYDKLIPMKNDKKIFGAQLYMDAEDHILGEEPRLLAGASMIGVFEVWDLVSRFGGVAYPAHIDRPSFSLLSNLGFWDASLGFPLAELSRSCPADFAAGRPDLAGVRTITGSDAHYLDQIADANQFMHLRELTIQAVLDWLLYGGEK